MCLLLCLPAAAAGLSPRELARAEELIERLARAESGADAGGRRRQADGVRDAARRLPEGDVRADLEAAARLLSSTSNAARLDCPAERPGAYRKLCETSATPDELRARKARLHLAWARARVRNARGVEEAGDAELMREAEAERAAERALALRALEALRRLEGAVVVYRTRADFEEGGALARVTFESFDARLARASREVGLILAWLPESRPRAELRHALRSYADGRFWWARARCARVVEAGADCLSEAVRWRLGAAYPGAASYSVAVHWRNAARHLARAARHLGSPGGFAEAGDR